MKINHKCVDCRNPTKLWKITCTECTKARMGVGWINYDDHTVFHEQRSYREGGFHAYIISTNRGHFIGHTSNMTECIRSNIRGNNPLTADLIPLHIWHSPPMKEREFAIRFTNILKYWSVTQNDQYKTKTRREPHPYVHKNLMSYLNYQYGRRWLKHKIIETSILTTILISVSALLLFELGF